MKRLNDHPRNTIWHIEPKVTLNCLARFESEPAKIQSDTLQSTTPDILNSGKLRLFSRIPFVKC